MPDNPSISRRVPCAPVDGAWQLLSGDEHGHVAVAPVAPAAAAPRLVPTGRPSLPSAHPRFVCGGYVLPPVGLPRGHFILLALSPSTMKHIFKFGTAK